MRNNHGFSLIISNCVIQDTSSDGFHGFVGDARLMKTTVRNSGGAGISMVYGSKLMLEAPTTISQGNVGALWCGDQESSVNDLGLLDAGGDTVFCTGY